MLCDFWALFSKRAGGDTIHHKSLRPWALVVRPVLFALAALAATAAVPEPISRWNFDGDARDSVGALHGELLGDASIMNGRLVLKGNGAVRTAHLSKTLGTKTLVARVKVDPLEQGGGGVFTVQSRGGEIFDAIVYGERRAGQWIAGSDEFRRTRDLTGAFPEEARAGFVQMAITYAEDGTISVYRNGRSYGEPYRPNSGLLLFSADIGEVLFGMRHSLGRNPYLKGEIEDAALYDRALTAAEVAELAGIGPVDESEVVRLEFAATQLSMEESETKTIVVRRTGRLDQPVSAALELRAGSAEVTGAAADIYLDSGQQTVGLNFQTGQTELAVSIQARLDQLVEGPETATAHLTVTGNAQVIGGPATITVMPWINRVRVSGGASEIDGGFIHLALPTGLGGRVRVQTTDAGTATPGVDFVPLDQEVDLTGLGGIPSQRGVSVPLRILQDNRIEGEETIGIRVTALTDDTEITGGEALLPLVEGPVVVHVEAEAPEVSETSEVVRFSLTRVGAIESPDRFHVRYWVEGWDGDEGDGPTAAPARLGVDFENQEGEVEIGPGVTRIPIEVRLLNDFEADGPRGLVLKLLGSPDFPNAVHPGKSTAQVVILDNESRVLTQEFEWQAFLPGTSQSELRLVDRPGGKSMFLGSDRALQLTASGAPDREFGQGSGTIFGRPEDWNGRWPTPRQTPDGRLVFLRESESKIRRLLVDGTPDLSFGSATGTLTLTNNIVSVVHLFPDGGLALLVESGPETWDLIRLRPNGRPDERFQPHRLSPRWWGIHPTATHAPDGAYWISDSEMSLRRLLADGTDDPAFGGYPGVTDCFGFDVLGRGYFYQSGVGMIRFMPGGAQDIRYLVPDAVSGFDRIEFTAVILPDGSSVIGSTTRGDGHFNTILSEFDPEGKLRREAPLAVYVDSASIRSLERVADGRFLAHFYTADDCFSAYVDFDGRVTRSHLDLVGSTSTWRFESKSTPSGWEYYLSRTLRSPTASLAGIGRNGLLGSGNTARLPFQRTGNTSHPATLAGRVYPLLKGQTDARRAVAFEVSFPANLGSVDATIQLPVLSDSGGPRNYLVRVENAVGVELSPLNECRLWIFDERILPPTGENRLFLASSPETPDTVWWLGWWDPNNSVGFNSTPDLAAKPGWSTSDGDSTGGPASMRVLPISTHGSRNQFFRLP